MLPIGIIGLAISVVTLPSLSKALQQKQYETIGTLFSQSILFLLTLTVPFAVGMYYLSEPVVHLLFEYNAFTRTDTRAVAEIMQILAFSTPLLAMFPVHQCGSFGPNQKVIIIASIHRALCGIQLGFYVRVGG